MLKKIISLALALALTLSIITFPASADDPISVFLDGVQLTFDVPPQLMNDRTMVPLRAVFEAMGAYVDWDGDTETVTGTKGDTVVVLTIGDTSPTINGQVVTIDQPGVIVNDRTLAPLRFVGEAFGGIVEWDGDTQTVTITSSGEPISPPPVLQQPTLTPEPKPEPTATPQTTPTVAPTPSPNPTPMPSSTSPTSGSIDTKLMGHWQYKTNKFSNKVYSEVWENFYFYDNGNFIYVYVGETQHKTVGKYDVSDGKVYFTDRLRYKVENVDTQVKNLLDFGIDYEKYIINLGPVEYDNIVISEYQFGSDSDGSFLLIYRPYMALYNIGGNTDYKTIDDCIKYYRIN